MINIQDHTRAIYAGQVSQFKLASATHKYVDELSLGALDNCVQFGELSIDVVKTYN